MSKFIIDDGFSPELIERAMFDGVFEIPLIHRNDETIIPSGLIPYSRRNTAGYNDCFLMFYENDVCFRDIFVAPDKMLTLARQYKGVISPDCSLYWDMPLALQIYNTYRNRQFGCFLQENGVYVIPNVRWGDERSYSQIIAGDKPFALQVLNHILLLLLVHMDVVNQKRRKFI